MIVFVNTRPRAMRRDVLAACAALDERADEVDDAGRYRSSADGEHLRVDCACLMKSATGPKP